MFLSGQERHLPSVLAAGGAGGRQGGGDALQGPVRLHGLQSILPGQGVRRAIKTRRLPGGDTAGSQSQVNSDDSDGK